MAKLSKIQGISDNHVVRLKKAGVTTIEKLLVQGAGAAGRKTIAKETKINVKTIDKWVHHADFFRIKGIAGLKTELLEAAGVPSMKKLATQNPTKLYETMARINDKKKLVLRVPGLKQIERWVKEAKQLKKLVK